MLSYSELTQWLHEQPEIQGVNLSTILDLPDPLRQTLQKMLHDHSMTLGQFAKELHFSLDEADAVSQILMQKGYLVVAAQADGDRGIYCLRLAKIRGRQISVDL